MPNPKRHHYIPESYLCRFTAGRTDQSPFSVFDIRMRQFRIQTPRNTGVQGYYNAVEQADGTRNLDIEKSLSRIEGEAHRTIAKVERREELDEKERGVLALFVATLKLRGPEFQDEVGQMMGATLRQAARLTLETDERAEESLAQFERDTGAPLGISAKELRAFILSDDYSINIHRNEGLRVMAALAGDTAKRFARMDWTFFHSPSDRAFITTDSPFYVMEPSGWDTVPRWYGFGYGTLGTQKFIPLTDRVCLAMYDPGVALQHRVLSEAGVRAINIRLAANAYRFVIARDEDLLRSLVRAVERQEKRGKFRWGGSKLVAG